jgi:hypothetical protein
MLLRALPFHTDPYLLDAWGLDLGNNILNTQLHLPDLEIRMLFHR